MVHVRLLSSNLQAHELQLRFKSDQILRKSLEQKAEVMYHDRKPSRQETRSRPTPSSAVYHSTINAATSDASRVIDDYDRAASLGLGININSVDSILNHHPSELLANMTNTPWVPNRALPPASFPKVGWRKGKWLDEEEAYTRKLIEAFNAGFLNLPSGTTLRSFLSERLCW